MGGPPVRPRSVETQEAISSRPGYNEARDLLEVINQSLKRKGVKIEEILSKDNPYVDELLKYAKDLADENERNPENEVPIYADINHITDVTHKDGILTLHYHDNPGLNQEIIKGEKIYNAIFWAEIKIEQEQIALRAKEAEAQRLAQKTSGERKPPQDEALQEIVPKKEAPVERFEETRDIEINGKDFDVKEAGLNYRIRVFMPKGFDGSVDMFFPGDTYTIEKVVEDHALKKRWLEKCQRGSRSAFVVVEGAADAIYGDKSTRYQKLKREGAFSAILRTFNQRTGKSISDVNILGHSRGGSALNMLISTGDGMGGLIRSVSYLDATYWDAKPIIAFARRGGIVNIAFKPGTKTEGPAMKLIKELGLTKIASGHWRSDDGKVNVHSAPTLSHSGISKEYVGPFMGNTPGGERVASYTGPVGDIPTFEQLESTYEKPGELHGAVLRKVETVDKAIVDQDFKKISDSNIDDIRFNSNLLTGGKSEEEKAKNLKDETYRRIRTYTGSYDGQWYTLDYAKLGADSKGLSHELHIGLGDILLDPDIKEILVERGGQTIKAHRGTVAQDKRQGGRYGFLDENDNYVATHTGDRFRILSASETNLGDSGGLANYLASVKEEEEKRGTSRKAFEANPESFAHDPGYYAGKTVDHYEFKPENYTSDDLKRIKRYGKDGIPPELPKDQVQVPLMGYDQAFNYYERICGNPPGGWLMKDKLKIFGTTVDHPNIILACLLVELEERCKQLGMDDLKFKFITTTRNSKKFHGLGLAVDFDPDSNWINRPNQTTWDLPLAFSNELQKMGFRWGMYFSRSRKDGKTDPMHFDIRTSLPNVIKMLTSKRAQDLAKSFNVPGKGISLYEYGASLAGKIH